VVVRPHSQSPFQKTVHIINIIMLLRGFRSDTTYVKGGYKMNQEELIQDWLDSSGQNYLSMQNMFNNNEYVWSLFVGHLCIEKLLKACYVKSVGNITPRIHDL